MSRNAYLASDLSEEGDRLLYAVLQTRARSQGVPTDMAREIAYREVNEYAHGDFMEIDEGMDRVDHEVMTYLTAVGTARMRETDPQR